MKKLILIGLASSLLSGCASSTDAALVTYENSYYDFSIDFPETYSYCINDFCYNELTDDLLTSFTLKDESGNGILQVQPYTNLLEMSAVEFGKRSLELNRANSDTLDDIYSEEEEITFAGQKAFTFLAENGFEERGGAMSADENGYIAIVDNPEAYLDPNFSLELTGTYRVIYLDSGNYFYRIIYPDQEEVQEIVDSFEFIQ